MKTEVLIEIIKKAFAHVKLEDGIGLWEAQAIDDYEPKLIQEEKRATDEKEDWTSISHQDLQRCHSSLSFFDAKGMRFHLPAFLVASINEQVDDPVFHLIHLDCYAKSKLTELSFEQRGAVSTYLAWCLEHNEYEFEKLTIQKVLDEYWK